jgi:hypothetical protein
LWPRRKQKSSRSIEGLTEPGEFVSREREDERSTRKPLVFWDRIKILLLLVLAWLVLLWQRLADFPTGFMPFDDAFLLNLRDNGWLLVLAAAEFVRQIHYFVSERSARYYQFWAHKVFGGFERRSSSFDDWTRFRMARLFKWLFWLLVVDLVVAEAIDESPGSL